MKAILIDEPGDETRMHVGETAAPDLIDGSVRVRVAGAGINRADLLQRQGLYPPPPGAPEILGLECSGEITELGAGVDGWQVGDRVMALLPGGGYAEEVVVHAGSLMPVPERIDLVEAAGLPEVLLTVFLNVFQLGGLLSEGSGPGSDRSLLVHGGGSGIGTAAIQLAKNAGAKVIVTAGSDDKCERCLDLGADIAINYRTGDFAAETRAATDGVGVNVVLDSIGGPYLADNLGSLAIGGRLVIIGLMGGAKSEINLGMLLAKRLQLIGSTLRARPDGEKAALVSDLLASFGDALDGGAIRPIIDRILPIAEAPEAHRVMKASEHFGKIVLDVR